MRPLSRRSFITAALAAAPAALLAGPAVLAQETSSLESTEDIEALRRKLRELSLNTASGGGVNVKFMPDVTSGEPTVPLPEVFSFDRHHAICRVDTNPEAFTMPTFAMGDVAIEPHSFFMSMVATSIDQYAVTTEPGGTRRATLRGGVDCSTEVGQAETMLGSRTAAEHATYLIEAVDGGIGGGQAGDSFAFTVFFDLDDAPINHAIFGPEFTFTGDLVAGEITIVDPAIRA